jgi:Kef-type K+ transport system membrane component KefB
VQLHLLLPAVLITAKLLGAVARRWGLPAVVGEILAGVVLGPSLLGVLGMPGHGEGENADPLLGLAQIGLCVLLFRVGLETEIDSARRVAGPATVLAGAGMLLPLGLGTLGALAVGVDPAPAIFIGATLTATSIGVTASVLEELGASATRAATLILGAAVIDDVLGLVLLAALIAVSTAEANVGVEIALAVGQAIGFLVAALWLGRPLARATVRLTRWTRSRSTLFVLVFSTLLLTAAAAKAAGLEMIIGAYAAGLALASHPERDWLERELEPVIELFTPIFFVLVGSSIAFETLSLGTPAGRFTVGLAALLFLAAVAGKLLAPLVVRGFGVPKLAVGSALVPRGEVGLIFAQVGLAEGVLEPDLFAALALVITATTLAGPVLLRRLWPQAAEPPG